MSQSGSDNGSGFKPSNAMLLTGDKFDSGAMPNPMSGPKITFDAYGNLAGPTPEPASGNAGASSANYSQYTASEGTTGQQSQQQSGQQNRQAEAPRPSTYDPVRHRAEMQKVQSNTQGALYNIDQNMGYERYGHKQAQYDLYSATQNGDAGAEWAARQKIAGIEYNISKFTGQEWAVRQQGQRDMANVDRMFGPDAKPAADPRGMGKDKMQQQRQQQEGTGRNGSNVPGSSAGGRGGGRGSGGARGR